MTRIYATETEWNARHTMESNLRTRAYESTGLDWDSYSVEMDLIEGNYIFFIRNNLITGDGGSSWENDPENVVSVDVVINGD